MPRILPADPDRVLAGIQETLARALTQPVSRVSPPTPEAAEEAAAAIWKFRRLLERSERVRSAFDDVARAAELSKQAPDDPAEEPISPDFECSLAGVLPAKQLMDAWRDGAPLSDESSAALKANGFTGDVWMIAPVGTASDLALAIHGAFFTVWVEWILTAVIAIREVLHANSLCPTCGGPRTASEILEQRQCVNCRDHSRRVCRWQDDMAAEWLGTPYRYGVNSLLGDEWKRADDLATDLFTRLGGAWLERYRAEPTRERLAHDRTTAWNAGKVATLVDWLRQQTGYDLTAAQLMTWEATLELLEQAKTPSGATGSHSEDSATGMVPPENARPSHSPDFASVNWFGVIYEFTTTQAACVRFLWEAWENGTPSVGQQAILEAADVSSQRLTVVFRNHPALETMIVPGTTKGRFRLNADPPARTKLNT